MSSSLAPILVLSLCGLLGCQYGLLGKRTSECHCPTDIRQTIPGYPGEDAIFHCPCGPSHDYFGYKPTCWGIWPSPGREWREQYCGPLAPDWSAGEVSAEGSGQPLDAVPGSTFRGWHHTPEYCPPGIPLLEPVPANQPGSPEPLPERINGSAAGESGDAAEVGDAGEADADASAPAPEEASGSAPWLGGAEVPQEANRPAQVEPAAFQRTRSGRLPRAADVAAPQFAPASYYELRPAQPKNTLRILP